MRIGCSRFNLYLLAGLVAVMSASGCSSITGKKKEASTLRLHLEVTSDGSDKNGPVPIYRENPIQINVEKEAFLNEASLTKAAVVDAMGGFSIFLQFDKRGTWILEQYSVANKGRRVAIFSAFGEARWLAAPIMTKRISDGVFVFTPDATREEAERIVRGLNNVAKEMQSEWH